MDAPVYSVVFECPRCGNDLPALDSGSGELACPVCNTRARCFVFPASARIRSAQHDHPVLSAEASCFFHDDRVAAFTCSHCGRFLCNLCRIEWGGRDLCSSCVQDQSTTTENNMVSSLFQYDSLALALSVFGGLTVVFTTLTAPISLGLALFTIGKRSSITPRSKWRSVVAILLSLAQIGGWIALFIYGARQARATR